MRSSLAAAFFGLTLLLGACVTAGEPRSAADNDAPASARPGGSANRAVQDDRLIDEILAAARKVTWEKKNFTGYSFVYDESSRLLWATGLDRAASFRDASTWLGQLSIDSMDGWRMPTHPEFLGSRIFPESAKCNVPPYNSAYANEVYQGQGWTSTTNPYNTEQAFVISYSTGGACGRHEDWSEYKSKNVRIYAVRDIDELAAILIDPRLSAEAQLVAVAKVLLREKIKYVSTPLTAPAEPEPVRAKALKRGEFEPAADFAKRQQQEQARADAETKRVTAAHEQAMREFNAQKAAEERREAAWRESLKTNATRQRLAEAALSEAFNLVFGSPTLKNVQYNPDKEAFDALLGGSRASILAATSSQVTQRGGNSGSGFAKKSSYQNNAAVAAPPLAAQKWTMQLSIPTPLKEAQAFKARLVDARLIPRLTFNWDSRQTRLAFAGYEIITNEVKQQREFASARQANTVEAYQDFVDRYPKAPQVAQAKQGIREIQARLEKERQEQIARQKAEEKRRRAEEAAEAAAMRERERLGCDNFYPGKTGKIMGKSFWFETVDGYIVRYVNKDRRLVTIQGVRGGTTLGEDQYHEISCSDLIYSTRW
jgi:hypothetical protein